MRSDLSTSDMLDLSSVTLTNNRGWLCGAIALTLKPSRCIKASFYIPENRLNLPATKDFRTKITMKLVYQHMTNFFNFFTPFKSSSSTISRELRQQFLACSG